MPRLNNGPGALRAQRNKQYHSAPQQPSDRNRRYNDGNGAGYGFTPTMLRARPSDVRKRMADARLFEQEQVDSFFDTDEHRHCCSTEADRADHMAAREVLRWAR